MMGEDFLCGYQPGGGATIEPLLAPTGSIAWSAEAAARLERVPAFVRRFVRRRAEDHARETGAQEVTAEHLGTLARRRFGDQGPPGVGSRGGFERPPEGHEP
jgi:hypothetical protein